MADTSSTKRPRRLVIIFAVIIATTVLVAAGSALAVYQSVIGESRQTELVTLVATIVGLLLDSLLILLAYLLLRQSMASQRRLERSEGRLQSIIQNAPHYIHMIDLEMTITFINQSADEVPVSQIIGQKVGSLSGPAERKRIHRKLREVLQNGTSVQYEFKSRGGTEAMAWYRANAGPIYTNGEVTGAVIMTYDITRDHHRTTALKEGKRAAESARAYDRALLDSIGEGLIVIDKSGKIANINPAGAKILGYRPSELIEKWFPAAVQAVDEHGEETPPLERPAMQALSSGQAVSEVLRYRRGDGSMIPAAVTISPVVIAGKPVGAIEVFRDLTKELELEQAKEEFVSLASHQLRTPATGVKAYISMLLDGYAGDLNERQYEFLSKVSETNERQLQIVNDMLNVARVDSGHIIPEMISIDLKQLLRDVVDEQRHTITERKQDLEVIMSEMPVEAVLDPKLIRMALENFVSNASKYTPEKGVIKVTLRKSENRALMCISDTGVGIARSDLAKIFKRFSRIDNPLSTKRGGTGLGLYLAQNIILLHHGLVKVESQPEKGTTFYVELPLRLEPKAVIRRAQEISL